MIDRVFAMMDDDPDMGPKLRDADVPMRYEFEDVDLVANIRAAREGEDGNLHWEWTDDVDWEPRVKMAMSSETANKYFQGKENVAMAIARRRIKSGGDVKAALALMPITKPVFARYRAMRRGGVSAPGRLIRERRVDRARAAGVHLRAPTKATGREVEGGSPPQGVANTTNAAGRGSGPHCPHSGGVFSEAPPLSFPAPRGSVKAAMAEPTAAEVAREIDVPPDTLRRWVAPGLVPLRDGALDAVRDRPRADRRPPARARALDGARSARRSRAGGSPSAISRTCSRRPTGRTR